MALINYNQQDDSATFNVGCSGQSTGVDVDGRLMDGTAVGSTPVACDPDNQTTAACCIFESTSPNVAEWAAGDYVVRINHSAMDGGTQLTRVDICDNNVGTYASVAVNTSPGHVRGDTGVITVTVNRATAYTPQSTPNSKVFIVLTYNNNDAHGASTFSITPDQIIDTPIDDGISGGAIAILALNHFNQMVSN